MAWIRTCQECGYKQPSKPPTEYKGDSWRDLKCRKCHSMALDYGKEQTENREEPS
jgi:ribosomal protein L40E